MKWGILGLLIFYVVSAQDFQTSEWRNGIKKTVVHLAENVEDGSGFAWIIYTDPEGVVCRCKKKTNDEFSWNQGDAPMQYIINAYGEMEHVFNQK